MRRWMLVVLGLAQTGCFAWVTPPIEARMGFGPAWDGRTRSVRPVPNYQATIPVSGWRLRAPQSGPAWDAQAGYLLQPLHDERVVHGPTLELGVLFPVEQTDPKPGSIKPDRGCLGPSNWNVVFRRYGLHGQVRGLFGDGAGVEAAARFSLEWARYVNGETGTEPKSLMRSGAFWAGYQATGVFIEASTGFQGTQPRWGVTAGLSFRVPASLGFGLPNTDRLRELDWVKKVNARHKKER
ncbi:hypothetical protein JQX13_20770 [Archangium violaceum]|uniref:hypothetical protein n=1 Tax=Archangium violaceum TaxID=83451 RepID=UPI00193C0910|nr:hypothetical protein [Archangium violaceum]QRK12253.1 hypothetical protein JQX13_20770 [Archangium violaceum]